MYAIIFSEINITLGKGYLDWALFCIGMLFKVVFNLILLLNKLKWIKSRNLTTISRMVYYRHWIWNWCLNTKRKYADWTKIPIELNIEYTLYIQMVSYDVLFCVQILVYDEIQANTLHLSLANTCLKQWEKRVQKTTNEKHVWNWWSVTPSLQNMNEVIQTK